MPEKKKEAKSCHDCGLEDFDGCEEKEPIHKPALEKDELPCSACARNPEIVGNRIDFYNEQWTRDFSAKGFSACYIEDPDPQEQQLLRNLHQIVNKGGE